MQITERPAGRLAQGGTERQPGVKWFPILLAALSVFRAVSSFRVFAALPASKTFPVLTALAALSAFFMGCAGGPSTARLGVAKGNFITVLIDPGHGGKDNGGTSGRLAPFQKEKDLTLDTAKRVRDELKRAGLRTLMTREDDHFVELDDRVAMGNQLGAGAILVSIHYNATGSSRPNGVQTFFWHANSHGLATRIQQAVVSSTGETNNGVTRRRLRLTRNPEIPCVLCECAYLTNPTENAKVAQDNYRQLIANGIASGILQEYRLGDEGIPSVPEIWAPLSRGFDKYAPTKKGKKHVRHTDEDARG
ncbi:MAG: N-acetylmuramoyl-L-alanine amidase [Verrucomicrobia bacterium]|nr:N-acetylmuramoyl-L-alanine amidase [Verrucomicrobiota bacterium]